jgi:hypothetical protein
MEWTMKRVLFSIMAAVMCLTSVTTAQAGAAGPGSQAEPLVTAGYLNGTFRQSLLVRGREAIDGGLGSWYASALERLGLDGADYSFADGLTVISLRAGAAVRLTTGSIFVLTSGAASLEVLSGSVVNISTGNVVSSGSALVLNQRYLCAENTQAVVTAVVDSNGQVDGYYVTDGVAAGPHSVFRDVKTTDWFYGAVDYVYRNKLFNGSSADMFSPGDYTKRCMFVTVLYRLAGTPVVADAGEFPDVADPALYYYGAVAWANGGGIVTGYSDGRFRPDDYITREQMAVIMYRYAEHMGLETGGEDVAAYEAFQDSGDVSGYAARAMLWAVSNGVINGDGSRLLPHDNATRAQVAQIIMNFRETVGRG